MEFYKLSQISPTSDFLSRDHSSSKGKGSKKPPIEVVLQMLKRGEISKTPLLGNVWVNIIYLYSRGRKKKTHKDNCGPLKKKNK